MKHEVRKCSEVVAIAPDDEDRDRRKSGTAAFDDSHVIDGECKRRMNFGDGDRRHRSASDRCAIDGVDRQRVYARIRNPIPIGVPVPERVNVDDRFGFTRVHHDDRMRDDARVWALAQREMERCRRRRIAASHEAYGHRRLGFLK